MVYGSLRAKRALMLPQPPERALERWPLLKYLSRTWLHDIFLFPHFRFISIGFSIRHFSIQVLGLATRFRGPLPKSLVCGLKHVNVVLSSAADTSIIALGAPIPQSRRGLNCIHGRSGSENKVTMAGNFL